MRLDREPELAAQWGSLTGGERGRVSTEAGPVRYLAVPLRSRARPPACSSSPTSCRANARRSNRTCGVGGRGGGVLLLATGVAWLVAGRLLRPVRQLTEAPKAITDTDLSRRIPVEGDDEIARLARPFNEMLDRLAAAFAAQRAFVDDAGHELRTPITIVRGHLELMGDDPEDRRETVALVTDELDRMARIVDDLLLLAKAEQPDFVQPAPVELADFTTELLVKARALGDRDWRLDACATGAVHADPQRLTQAVLNLARNAVEHTPTRRRDRDRQRLGRRGIRLWVRDTGPGIDRAERERIFERFARGRERTPTIRRRRSRPGHRPLGRRRPRRPRRAGQPPGDGRHLHDRAPDLAAARPQSHGRPLR